MMERYGLAAMINSLIVMVYSTTTVILAAGGITGPEMTALAMSGTMALVVIFGVGAWANSHD